MTKAIRAVIKLGDIELDVFQLENGEYRYSYDILAKIIPFDKSILSDKKSPFYLPTLSKGSVAIGKFSQTVSLKGISGTYKFLTEAQLSKCLMTLGLSGNLTAQAILEATFEEALERRADSAFGVQRTEEERNEKLKARVEGKLTRRTLTDAIKEYIDSTEVSSNYQKFVYSNCSDAINQHILGAKAQKIKDTLDTKIVRDVCNAKQLKELDLVEELICREIEEGGLEPLEATKFVLSTRRIKVLPLV